MKVVSRRRRPLVARRSDLGFVPSFVKTLQQTPLCLEHWSASFWGIQPHQHQTFRHFSLENVHDFQGQTHVRLAAPPIQLTIGRKVDRTEEHAKHLNERNREIRIRFVGVLLVVGEVLLLLWPPRPRLLLLSV